MNRDQLDRIIGQIRSLWPTWAANDAQVSLWGSRLERYAEDSVSLAVDEYKTGEKGNFKNPKLNELLDQCKIYQAKMHKRTAEEIGLNEPALDYTLQCLEHKNEKKIGSQLRFFCQHLRTQKSHDQRLQVAHNHAKDIADIYGGRWVPVMKMEDDF